MGGIRESLKESDRVVVAQKLSVFQKIISKVKDFQVLLQSTLLFIKYLKLFSVFENDTICSIIWRK
jgi:hypothetical protein